jgi:two-component system chemotaxis response regulator CheB
MQKQIRNILVENPEIEVIGFASDGIEAVKKIVELSPDVVTLDIIMPGMGGLQVLKKIMKNKPTRIVVISGADKTEADIAIKCMEEGAIDFITKPYGPISPLDQKKKEIIDRVMYAAKVDLKSIMDSRKSKKSYKREEQLTGKEEVRIVIVIGASLGGIKSLKEIIPRIKDFDRSAFLIVQHLSKPFSSSLAERLNKISHMKVVIAEEGEKIRPGIVYIAPGESAMTIENGRLKILAQLDNKEKYEVINKLFESVAREFAENAIGVILTGMGRDGSLGLKKLHDAGAFTIAESEETSAVFGMPKSAIEMGAVDEILPNTEIASALEYFIREIDKNLTENSSDKNLTGVEL